MWQLPNLDSHLTLLTLIIACSVSIDFYEKTNFSAILMRPFSFYVENLATKMGPLDHWCLVCNLRIHFCRRKSVIVTFCRTSQSRWILIFLYQPWSHFNCEDQVELKRFHFLNLKFWQKLHYLCKSNDLSFDNSNLLSVDFLQSAYVFHLDYFDFS